MPKLVHSVVHAAMQILRLVGAWSPSRRIWRSGDHDAHFLREFLLWNASARMDFKRRHAEKYLPLLSVLPASVEAPAWIIWAEGYWRSGYFALDPTRAATLFDWLRRCGVSGLSVGISVCSDATEGLARERAAIRGRSAQRLGCPAQRLNMCRTRLVRRSTSCGAPSLSKRTCGHRPQRSPWMGSMRGCLLRVLLPFFESKLRMCLDY